MIPRSDPAAGAVAQAAGDGYFDLAAFAPRSRDGSPATSDRRSSMSIQMPPSHFAVDLAFTALQYLPVPLLVLSSTKAIVLANEAMGRLLGIDTSPSHQSDGSADGHDLARLHSSLPNATDVLHGLSVGALGIDLIQNGNVVYVTWDDFLHSVLEDARGDKSTAVPPLQEAANDSGDVTPKPSDPEAVRPHESSRNGSDRATMHDVVVEVAFSSQRDPSTGLPLARPRDDAKRKSSSTASNIHIEATLIVSIWHIDDEPYFTLTFTATHNAPPTPAQQRASQRTVAKMHRNYMSGMGSGSSSSSGGKKYYTSSSVSPASGSIPWLPNAPASSVSQATSSSMLTKQSRMKDALINAIQTPIYAMWKDESIGIPNKAALRLLGGEGDDGNGSDQREFLGQYTLSTLR